MGEAKMSSVYGIFNSALSALYTYTSAIDVISTNIGNVETPGYSRQQAVIQATAPINTINGVIGTGVEVTNVQRVYNAFLTTQLRIANQDMGKWSAQQESLDAVEVVFSDSSDSGLSSTMASFWNNWQNLVNNPSGSTERSLLVNSADNLATTFNNMSSELESIQQGIDNSVVENVTAVNSLIQRIADLNLDIKLTVAAGQNTNSSKDELDLQVEKLAELININAYTNTNGQISIQMSNGKPLVEGTSTWLLGTQTNGTTYLQDITWSDGSATSTVVTDDITGGKLGGYLNVRDTIITDYQDQLNTLAQSVITNVNSLHTGGFDIDGVAGVAFFTGTNAADIAVNAAILADPGKIAAAPLATEAPGNGSNAAAIAALQNSLVMAGGTATFSSYYSSLVSKVGAAVQTTDASYSYQSNAMQAWQNQRDSYSGVSLDEEQTKLILYQSVYTASAKLISILDEMMKTLINL
jgi:flagellar hook-associated protein 1 FlgK